MTDLVAFVPELFSTEREDKGAASKGWWGRAQGLPLHYRLRTPYYFSIAKTLFFNKAAYIFWNNCSFEKIYLCSENKFLITLNNVEIIKYLFNLCKKGSGPVDNANAW